MQSTINPVIPKVYSPQITAKKSKDGQHASGRPKDIGMLNAFHALCTWLEKDACAEMYLLNELHDNMTEFASGAPVYSVKWLKQKLKEQ